MTLRHRLASSVAILALAQAVPAGVAFAQSAPAVPAGQNATQPSGGDAALATGNTTENIVVTGSRLKQSNATSESPIVEVTAAQIEHTQAQTLEDVLTKIPEIGTSGVYSTTNNGGGGVSCVDLRNLGVERTLVLVDGKRFVNTFSANCVDLNNIPLEQVERIEILKDGASTTYGADAIAGVINIILKHNFSGVTFHADGSIATQAGDDKTGNLSVLAGTNFDRGNFTVGADYLNQGPVYQADRAFGQYPVQSDNPIGGGVTSKGSSIIPNGRIFADTDTTNADTYNNLFNVLNKNGTLGPVYTGALSQKFNLGAEPQLSYALEKESLTSTVNYDFNDNISGYLEGFYTHKRTGERLSPQPVSAALPGAGLPDAYVVPEGNPYLSQLLGPDSGPIDIYKRETQAGDRNYTQFDNTFQINTGFKGNITGNWDYEVFFQYGEDDDQSTNANNINFLHLENQLGFQQTTATPAQMAAITATTGAFDPLTNGIYNPNVCIATAGCSLANPFGQNYTPAQLAYIRYTETTQARETQKIYGGNITNNALFQLPAGPVGVFLGLEHRTEFGQFTPDSLDLTGEGLGSTARPTEGSFDVTELYGEVRVPILKDLPGAKDLHIDLGGRFFDYNTFGSGETWKVSGNYTPVNGIRFRGSDGVAFRQPSINDLYTGDVISFNGANDPCAQVSSYGSKAGIVQANCAKQGINTATFAQVGSQVQAIEGGNPALTPETARTQTVGVVLNPPFVPRLAVTVDFSRTKIDNSIGVLPPQFILDSCYTQASFNPGTTAASDPCRLVSTRTGAGQLNTITEINENLGVTRTEALDIGGTYSYPIGGYGVLSFQNDLTITLKYQEQSIPNGPYIGYLGTIGALASSLPSYPHLRDNASVDWKLGNFGVGYRMRYIQGTTFDTYPGPYVQGKLSTQFASAATPDVFYHDVNLSYDVHNFSLNLGVQNLFNKQPPYVFDTGTNTDAAVYDVFGRVVYLKTTLRF